VPSPKGSSSEGRKPTHFSGIADTSGFSLGTPLKRAKVGVFSGVALVAFKSAKPSSLRRFLADDLGDPAASGRHSQIIEFSNLGIRASPLPASKEKFSVYPPCTFE
jgi:hypothetical protein